MMVQELNLKQKYNEIYVNGKENFHTFPLQDIYETMFDFMKDHIKGKSILDLGCGDGAFVLDYLTKETEEIIGIDFSEVGIKKAKEKAKLENYKESYKFIECDFNKIDDSLSKYMNFDVIVSIGVIEHLDDPSLIFKIARDKLIPSGFLFLNHPNFLNLRGIIWKALELFCNVKMSLTDKHTMMPDYILKLAQDNGFKIEKVKTIRESVGMGKDLLKDYNKRLRKALSHIEDVDKKVDEFLGLLSYMTNSKVMQGTHLSGSEIFYRFRKI